MSSWLTVDSYDNKIPAGLQFCKGQFPEKDNEHRSHTTYKLGKGKNFFYKESVIYPCVQMELGKKGLILHNHDYLDVIYHVEQTGYAHFSHILLRATIFFHMCCCCCCFCFLDTNLLVT